MPWKIWRRADGFVRTTKAPGKSQMCHRKRYFSTEDREWSWRPNGTVLADVWLFPSRGSAVRMLSRIRKAEGDRFRYYLERVTGQSHSPL